MIVKSVNTRLKIWSILKSWIETCLMQMENFVDPEILD